MRTSLPVRHRVSVAAIAVVVTASALWTAAAAGRPAARTTTSSSHSCTTASQLATWSLAALARETITVPVEGSSISQAGPIAAAGYGGLLIFGTSGPSNFKSVVAGLRAQVPHHAGLLVMTDDEGGGVWRLANLLPALPWARTMSSMTPAQITAAVTKSAKAMKALGISMDLAPVLDIDGRNEYPGNANADGYRSFSGNGAVVSKDAVAYLKGLLAGGVVPVVKHFPGLGGVSPNTDVGPAKTAPWSSVQKVALKPFQAAIAAGVPALMIANVVIPGLTSQPATVAPAVYHVLRQQLGFKGLLMTDSLSAGAISSAHLSLTAASVAALSAGADVVLFGLPASGSALSQANAIVAKVVAAVSAGTLTRATLVAAATQVLAAKNVNLCSAA